MHTFFSQKMLPSNTKDMAKIMISEFSTKIYFAHYTCLNSAIEQFSTLNKKNTSQNWVVEQCTTAAHTIRKFTKSEMPESDRRQMGAKWGKDPEI